MTHVSVRRGLLYVSIAATAWGTGGAAGALLHQTGGLGPVAVSFWRFAAGAAVLLLARLLFGLGAPRPTEPLTTVQRTRPTRPITTAQRSNSAEPLTAAQQPHPVEPLTVRPVHSTEPLLTPSSRPAPPDGARPSAGRSPSSGGSASPGGVRCSDGSWSPAWRWRSTRRPTSRRSPSRAWPWRPWSR
ncbi:hypothetical protein [Streptosporangium vulgare]|uniref:hypothetical protein n=1 Tax=Streptosporangium vulgare TaxID=46190 RepID=UPI0031DCD3D7